MERGRLEKWPEYKVPRSPGLHAGIFEMVVVTAVPNAASKAYFRTALSPSLASPKTAGGDDACVRKRPDLWYDTIIARA